MSGMQSWGLLATVGALTFFSCSGTGSSSGDNGSQLVTSIQDLCSGAPEAYSGGYATTASCPFLQQTDNIMKYGQKLPEHSALYSATGAQVGTVTNNCDKWTMGVDAQGVTIVVDRESGRVISHGSLHPGQQLSQVASPLALPLKIQ
jgi:hypothetical protein